MPNSPCQGLLRAAVELLSEDCSQLESVFKEKMVASWQHGWDVMLESAFRTIPLTEARAVMADNLLNVGWEASATSPERKALKEFAKLTVRLAQLVETANRFTSAKTRPEKKLRCADIQVHITKFRESLGALTSICKVVEDQPSQSSTSLTGIDKVDEHNRITTDPHELWLSLSEIARLSNQKVATLRRKAGRLKIKPYFRERGASNGKAFYRYGDLKKNESPS